MKKTNEEKERGRDRDGQIKISLWFCRSTYILDLCVCVPAYLSVCRSVSVRVCTCLCLRVVVGVRVWV